MAGINLNETLEKNAQGASFLTGNNVNDGIYRPSLRKSKDGKVYKARLRFLPNLTQEGTVGLNGIEKKIHYVNIPTLPDVQGVYESQKGVNGNINCRLTNQFFQFITSNDQDLKDKADMIRLNTKWYSYVYIIEDEQQPELEGRVMIFAYTKQIADKMSEEEPCDVFKLTTGKNFNLVIKNKGGGGKNITYEPSSFAETSSAFKDNDGTNFSEKTEDGTIRLREDTMERLNQLLLERDANIEDYKAKEWSAEESRNVDLIIAHLNGDDITTTFNSSDDELASVASAKSESTPDSNEVDKSDAFEDDDDWD